MIKKQKPAKAEKFHLKPIGKVGRTEYYKTARIVEFTRSELEELEAMCYDHEGEMETPWGESVWDEHKKHYKAVQKIRKKLQEVLG